MSHRFIDSLRGTQASMTTTEKVLWGAIMDGTYDADSDDRVNLSIRAMRHTAFVATLMWMMAKVERERVCSLCSRALKQLTRNPRWTA